MSRILKLLTMTAAMAAAGSAMTPYDARPKRSPIPKRKAEQPKCKTCVHFGEARRCCEPMKVCCDAYKRRKKK